MGEGLSQVLTAGEKQTLMTMAMMTITMMMMMAMKVIPVIFIQRPDTCPHTPKAESLSEVYLLWSLVSVESRGATAGVRKP